MSLPQNMAALATANQRRLARAELHNEVKALGIIEGRERIAALLVEAPVCIGSLRIVELLMWGRRIGELQARRILRSAVVAAVSEHGTVGGVTERQRLALARYLRGEAEAESRWSA